MGAGKTQRKFCHWEVQMRNNDAEQANGVWSIVDDKSRGDEKVWEWILMPYRVKLGSLKYSVMI